MDAPSPFYAYKETRLDLDSSIPNSTVAIRLPGPGASSFSSRAASKRSQIAETPVADDEDAFRQKFLATAASIYYRTPRKSKTSQADQWPRSFLWRVLEDGKVLSIRAVDGSKRSKDEDTDLNVLTLRLNFPSAIKPGCVALSDSEKHDVLSVFVLTESKHLYTLSLRPGFFRRPSSTEGNVEDWCKSYNSSTFGFKQPHRLISLSPDDILVSLIDGALLKLSRIQGGDGAEWTETHYNEGGWGHGLRSIIPFQGNNTIQYENHNLDLSAATSIVSSAAGVNGSPYAFTVCLDHRLRIWNLSNRKIAYTGDILTPNVPPHEQARKVIDPSQSQLVKVLSDGHNNVVCITYSPLGSGLFKFWEVQQIEDGSLQLTDLFVNIPLEPLAPSAEIWTLADFSVVAHEGNVHRFTLWALWKNNVTYRVHRLDFEGGPGISGMQVVDAWRDDWQAMATETLRTSKDPEMFSSDPADGTDKWLQFLLTPGKYSEATVETALAIYGRGLGYSKGGKRRSGTLPERMCATIASTSILDRGSDGDMDYAKFRKATHEQWTRFHRLLVELDKQRGEAMSLVTDPLGDMPWVVLADGLTAIRDCSDLERIWHNHKNELVPPGTEHVARPLFGAANFRRSLPAEFMYSCRAKLLEEIFQEPLLTDSARMRAFYETCDFSNQIGDEQYNELVEDLGGTFKDLTPQVYDGILELLNVAQVYNKKVDEFPVAEFGNKMILKAVQETVEVHCNICLDQLILLILIENEINHSEEGIQFETAAVFSQLLGSLRRLELINWLSTTQITLPLKRKERSNSITESASSSLAKKPIPGMETVTVFEGMLRHLLGIPKDGLTTSYVTGLMGQVCAIDSEYESPPSSTQAFLLKNDRADLALEFSRFAGHDAYSTYIQGRVYLAVNDAFTAATLFKKAAFGIAHPDANNKTGYRSAGFLNHMELDILNGAGLPEYYAHIVALYDKEKNYSFVIDFARMSLQFMPHGPSRTQIAQIRTEMHSRLLNAAIQTCRYELAHSILALFTDPALQQSCLRTLVTKMCEFSYANQLIELPFIGLQESVDEILAQKCQSIVDVNVGVPYHKILYAWRIKHNDYRGAASICLARLQRLQQAGDGDQMIGDDGLETSVTKQYVALINALSCVDPQQAWIFSEEVPRKESVGESGAKSSQPKRKVVTLQDIRREYQVELDRIAAIQNNQFSFAGDEMDVL